MKKPRVVVIEDEAAIRRGVCDALRVSGYDVGEASDGVKGLTEACRPDSDLILLDLMLPKKDGLEVLRELRQSRPAVPVIILTARGSEDDRVRGLKLGADDYVVKPFSARELLARVEAVLRRSSGQPTGAVTHARLGHAVIDLRRREVDWGDGRRTDLSETECGILLFLVEQRKRAVSREEMLSRLWGLEPAGIETRTVDMHVARLRTKLRDPDGKPTPEAILTVRAHGYMAGPELHPFDPA
jgi:DNA-binding response OmpR family regulator